MAHFYNDPKSVAFYRKIVDIHITPKLPRRFPDKTKRIGGPIADSDLPKAPSVAEFVTNVVEETKVRTGEIKFESHAFKVLQDYKLCRERYDNELLCLTPLVVELASIVIPLARSNAKDKEKRKNNVLASHSFRSQRTK